MISGCQPAPIESRLTRDTWIITKAYFHGSEIELQRNAPLVLINRNGERYVTLHFAEDKRIDLPGLDAYSIPARWTFDGKQIVFTIDTTYYNARVDGEKTLELPLIFRNDSLALDSLRALRVQEVTSELNALKQSFAIFEQPFIVKELKKDALTLQSRTTTIYAIRDNTLDNILP